MRKVTLSIRDSGLQLYNYAGLKIQLQWLAYISKSELHANKRPAGHHNPPPRRRDIFQCASSPELSHFVLH